MPRANKYTNQICLFIFTNRNFSTMHSIKDRINNYLSNLKGTGNFCSIHTTDFVFPQLHLNGLGEIGFPINELQAKQLIKIASKAPFGKGTETIVDTKVRSAWQIEASQIHFEGENWLIFLNNALDKVKKDLGIEHAEVTVHLYKMLIYEEGDFFLKHKDTEKEKGMFGSLVIGLPSSFAGGELAISFEGEEKVADFSKNPYQLNYTAFYADCDHEVKLLISGYRVCLVYNLVQEKNKKPLSALATQSHVDNLAELLVTSNENQPFVILLGHQYTPENFSSESLKLNDRLKADVLLKAAAQLGLYSKMCLVTSFVTGSPEYNGYGYDDDNDDSTEISEVLDEWIEIEHWLPSPIPSLGNLKVSADDLIASFPINVGDSLETENTGYMGNYGPDISHWYYYGAVVIWNKETNSQLFATQYSSNLLEWITYFNIQPDCANPSERAAMEAVIRKGLEKEKIGEKTNFDVVGDWILNNSPEFFLKTQNPEVLRSYFKKISVPKWLEVLDKCSASIQKYFFAEVMKEVSTTSMAKWAEFCSFCTQKNTMTEIIPDVFANATTLLGILFEKTKAKSLSITAQTLRDLIIVEEKLSKSADWSNSLAEILTNDVSRDYVHQVLIPVLQEFTKKNKFTNLLLDRSRNYLQSRADKQPQPPQNWAREVPSVHNFKKQWAILRSFLEDTEMQFFDFKNVQQDRSDMQTAISNVVIDLKTETIKKGTPHTLRIIKTQDAYMREMKIWEEDVKILENVVNFTKK